MTKQALFAGGCFWGVEAAFQKLGGVVSTQVGYSGGHLEEPSYVDVCSDTSGHAETVLVTYDPKKISYNNLVEAFFEIHDPTAEGLNCADFGTQYRSVIFYTDPQEEETAREVISRLNTAGKFSSAINTQVEPATIFWPAENYHQQYYQRHGLVDSL